MLFLFVVVVVVVSCFGVESNWWCVHTKGGGGMTLVF